MSVAFVPPMCSCCVRRKPPIRRAGQDPHVIGIIAAVVAATGISVTRIRSRNRTHRVALARALVAARIHQELNYNHTDIGALLGRDRTSVIAMIRKVDKVRKEIP